MKEQSIVEVGESRPVWESLEALARQGVQRLLQQLLEEEVEQALGRVGYALRGRVDRVQADRHRRMRRAPAESRRRVPLSSSRGCVDIHRQYTPREQLSETSGEYPPVEA